MPSAGTPLTYGDYSNPASFKVTGSATVVFRIELGFAQFTISLSIPRFSVNDHMISFSVAWVLVVGGVGWTGWLYGRKEDVGGCSLNRLDVIASGLDPRCCRGIRGDLWTTTSMDHIP